MGQNLAPRLQSIRGKGGCKCLPVYLVTSRSHAAIQFQFKPCTVSAANADKAGHRARTVGVGGTSVDSKGVAKLASSRTAGSRPAWIPSVTENTLHYTLPVWTTAFLLAVQRGFWRKGEAIATQVAAPARRPSSSCGKAVWQG